MHVRPGLRTYGTLDDLPEGLHHSLAQIEQLTTARFAGYHGIVIYGPTSLSWPHGGYWGRGVELGSRELLQMRFEPPQIIDADVERVDRALIATRIMSPSGRVEVRAAILFRPGLDGLAPDGMVMADQHTEAASRVVGARGLHVLMAGLFRRHHPELGREPPVITANAPLQHDSFGFEALRSTTYSVHERVKSAGKPPGHAAAVAAVAGPSAITVANELVDRNTSPPETLRAAQPLARQELQELQTRARRELTATAGGEVAAFALSSAATLLEQISAEGLVGMSVHPFFDGALPERLVGPHGVPLALCVAMRLAIHWEKYKLPTPSTADQYANEHMRAVWATQGPANLPILQNQWAIDLVVEAAIGLADAEMVEVHRREGLARTTALPQVEDNKVWWQRVGQRLITSVFGLGSVYNHPQENRVGTPWRTYDAEQQARDETLYKLGCKLEGVTECGMHLGSVGQRRTALVRMVVAVERWLRDGRCAGKQVSPSNDTRGVDEQVDRLSGLLGKLMLPQVIQALADACKGEACAQELVPETAYAKVLEPHLNILALDNAIQDAKTVLMHGPMLYTTHGIGSYVVAPTQTTPCCECEAPVHVLPATIFQYKLSFCTACRARRCFDCATAHARSIDNALDQMSRIRDSGPMAIGCKCRACGAEPESVVVRYTKHPDGKTRAHYDLTERVYPGLPEKHLRAVAEFPNKQARTGPKK